MSDEFKFIITGVIVSRVRRFAQNRAFLGNVPRIGRGSVRTKRRQMRRPTLVNLEHWRLERPEDLLLEGNAEALDVLFGRTEKRQAEGGIEPLDRHAAR